MQNTTVIFTPSPKQTRNNGIIGGGGGGGIVARGMPNISFNYQSEDNTTNNNMDDYVP
jgi:hypothetical protein